MMVKPVSATPHRNIHRPSCSAPTDECVSTPWPEFLAHIAELFGIDALVVRAGAFMIAERVYVCHRDTLERGLETGWTAVRLPSIDGRARADDLNAPRVLVAPNARCLIWQPYGGLRQQRPISLSAFIQHLVKMGEDAPSSLGRTA